MKRVFYILLLLAGCVPIPAMAQAPAWTDFYMSKVGRHYTLNVYKTPIRAWMKKDTTDSIAGPIYFYGDIRILPSTYQKNILIGHNVGTRFVSTPVPPYYNIGIGNNALGNKKSGNGDIAIGYNALLSDSGGQGGNTAIGYEALRDNRDGTGNVAVGFDALFALREGSNNTVVGYAAGGAVEDTIGNNNVFLGFEAGKGYVKSDFNTAVGASTTVDSGGTAVGYGAAATKYHSGAIGYGVTARRRNYTTIPNIDADTLIASGQVNVHGSDTLTISHANDTTSFHTTAGQYHFDKGILIDSNETQGALITPRGGYAIRVFNPGGTLYKGHLLGTDSTNVFTYNADTIKVNKVAPYRFGCNGICYSDSIVTNGWGYMVVNGLCAVAIQNGKTATAIPGRRFLVTSTTDSAKANVVVWNTPGGMTNIVGRVMGKPYAKNGAGDSLVLGEIQITRERKKIHGIQYFSLTLGTAYAMGLTATKDSLISNTTRNFWTVQENGGLTMQGDTLICLRSGDYDIYWSLGLSGGNGKDYTIKVYVNGVALPANTPLTCFGASNYTNVSNFNYMTLNAGDRVGLWIGSTSETSVNLLSGRLKVDYIHDN